MRPRRLRSDHRAMSGKWQAFAATMAFLFGSVIIFSIWPIRSGDILANSLSTALGVFEWILGGSRGEVFFYAFLAIGWFILLGAAYLALEKIYSWAQDRRDGTVNEYQVK